MEFRFPFIKKPRPLFTKNELFFAAVYFVQAAVVISALALFVLPWINTKHLAHENHL